MFIEAKDDGSGGDNWSCKPRKAPIKSSPPTNQQLVFTGRMPFLSPNQQCQSTDRSRKFHLNPSATFRIVAVTQKDRRLYWTSDFIYRLVYSVDHFKLGSDPRRLPKETLWRLLKRDRYDIHFMSETVMSRMEGTDRVISHYRL